jgi:hypothetical protein
MTAHQHGSPWLLVVGAHRSGTSAVTGALGALGFTVPGVNDRMDWPESNPEHWESLSLSLFNEDLLERLGGSWDAPPEVPDDWRRGPALGGVRDPGGLLTVAFVEGGPSVWKDPRICLLLDYWREALTAPLAAVLVWRSPLAVTRSLAQRDGLDLLDGLALWERYNRSALSGLFGVDTYVAPYESIVADPGRFVGDVAGWLGTLDQFAPYADRWDAEAATASIDRSLHHQSGEHPQGSTAVVTEQQQELAEQLTRLSGGHRSLEPVPMVDESPYTSAIVRLRREVAPLRAEVARLTRRLTLSEEAIANMRESTSWRMTKPVRSVASRRHNPPDPPD